MSSALVQLTVVPGFTVKTCDLKVKLAICTEATDGGAAFARSATGASSRAADRRMDGWKARIFNVRVMLCPRSGGEGGIDQRDPVVAPHEHGVGDAKHRVELLGR